MTDFSSIQTKVDNLKAKVEQKSISPVYLGSLLDDFISLMKGIDVSEPNEAIRSAVSNSTEALEKARASLAKAGEANLSADSAVQNALTAIEKANSAIQAADNVKGRAAEIGILPFDGFFEQDEAGTKKPPRSGVWFFVHKKRFGVITSELNYTSGDYNILGADGSMKSARADRLYRHNDILYRFDGTKLVEVTHELGDTAGTAYPGDMGKQLREEFDSLCELFDENDGKTEVALFRSKETAILPFDSITYNIGQNQHPGIHYFAPGKQFILRTSDSQYYKDLDYKISDYNEVDEEGNPTTARADRLYRIDNVIYRFDGNRLVPVGGGVIPVTYAALIERRDGGQLLPGTLYRITDYETTVANDPEARSAGHPFDLVVMALDEGTLSERAWAKHSSRDTDGYFASAKPEAWQVWYCADNDTTRFQWADADNGKGVIYRLIDEWGNDCPYDFKNVQFKRYKVSDICAWFDLLGIDDTYIGYNGSMQDLSIEDEADYIWAYTFSIGDRKGTRGNPLDATVIRIDRNVMTNAYLSTGYFGDNVIKPSTASTATDDNDWVNSFCLNNVIWFIADIHDSAQSNKSQMNGNFVGSECVNMTLSGHGNHIGYNNKNIVMGLNCSDNIFHSRCSNITMDNLCGHNTFVGETFSDNGPLFYGGSMISLGYMCVGNIFGVNFNQITMAPYCSCNEFGANCSNNHFEDNCFAVKCGDNVRDMNIAREDNADELYYVRDVIILSGTHNPSGAILRVPIPEEPQSTVCRYVGLNSAGELKIWVPADLV